jgi:hypothetical protein
MKIQLFAMINKIKNKESKNEKHKCPTTTLTMGDIIRRKKKEDKSWRLVASSILCILVKKSG